MKGQMEINTIVGEAKHFITVSISLNWFGLMANRFELNCCLAFLTISVWIDKFSIMDGYDIIL